MPKIKVPQTLDNIKTFDDFRRFASLLFSQIVDVINGNIDVADNLRTAIVSCDFVAANAETQFEHSLGKIPSYYVTISASAAMVLYSGSTANTTEKIYLKSNAIGTASVLIF